MRVSVALLAVAAGIVSADVASYDSSLNMTIDASTIDAQTRATWCQAQTNTCTTLCDDSTDTNSCTQSTLAWDCTCASNSSAPGLQYYSQTIPTFICEELYSECISENTNSASNQKLCVTNIEDLCGTLDPADYSDDSATTTSATAAATKSSSTAAATDAAVTTTSSDGLAAPTIVPGMGAAAAAALGMMAYLI